MTARKEVLELYSKDELKEIAFYGCVSGAASHHIYYKDTTAFFDQHEEEILEALEAFDCNPLKVFGGDADTVSMLKNNLTWAFLELVAQQETD